MLIPPFNVSASPVPSCPAALENALQTHAFGDDALFLGRCNGQCFLIRSVIPGVIRPARDAKGKVKVRVTVPTQNGCKAIALSAGAHQELFVSTAGAKDEVEAAFRRTGGGVGDRDAPRLVSLGTGVSDIRSRVG